MTLLINYSKNIKQNLNPKSIRLNSINKGIFNMT